MSTKTSFKRIALVAVASLGLGLMSAAPSNAAVPALTMALGTITPADGSASVGSVVTIPVTLAVAAAGDTAGANTFTAAFNQRPVNTALTTSSLTAGVNTRVAAFATAGASLTQVTAATNVLTATYGATAAAVTAAAAGEYTFTPDVPGIYKLSIAAAGAAGTPTVTAVTNITIVVGGAQLTQATSGKGAATGTATTGGSAVVFYQLPGATAAAARFNVTSSGVGSVTAPVACATADATMVASATVVRCVNGAGASVGTGNINGTNSADGVFFTNTTLNAGNVLIGAAQTAALTFDAGSATAGTQTITITSIALASGAPTTAATVTITWGATPAISTTTSTSFIAAGGNAAANTAVADATVLASKSAGVDVANIAVTLKDGNGNALNGQKLTVTLDGPGLIGVDQDNNGVGATATNRIYADTTANTANVWQIRVGSDGTAGTGRITIAVGTTVVAVETVTFFGAIAKLVATNNLIAVANGSVTTDVVNVCALDSNGNVVPGAVLFGVTGDSTIAAVAATATANASSTAVVEDYDTGTGDPATGFNDLVNTAYRSAKANGCAGFSVTAASQTTKDSVVLTFRDAALAADATVSTTSTVKVGGKSAATVTLTSDKDSYAAGAKGTISLTFKDSTGRLVGAGAGTGTLTGALTSSASLQGATLFAANNNTKVGVVTADVYFPWNAGTVTITGTTGTNSTFLDSAARSAGLSKSITVTAAADSTSAQIASLISKINALSKLIAKIQKKLGIK